MKCWLSQHENTMLSVKNEARLATEQDQRGGSKGDLRRQEKVGESSFGKQARRPNRERENVH